MRKNYEINLLREFLKKYNVKIITVECYKKIFGNIILKFEYKDKIYYFITDRGETYFNDKLVCDNSYLTKRYDTVNKLIQVIDEKVFQI